MVSKSSSSDVSAPNYGPEKRRLGRGRGVSASASDSISRAWAARDANRHYPHPTSIDTETQPALTLAARERDPAAGRSAPQVAA